MSHVQSIILMYKNDPDIGCETESQVTGSAIKLAAGGAEVSRRNFSERL